MKTLFTRMQRLGHAIFVTVLLAGALCSAQEGDPYLWLEEIEGEKQLAWVESLNDSSLAYFEKLDYYREYKELAYKMLTDESKLVIPEIHDGQVYNFWQDEKYSRGVLRRKSLDKYRNREGEWEIVLNLDSLAQASGIPWVYQSISFAGPQSSRCMIQLSEGGTDASHLMEFDVRELRFIREGFNVPAAKSYFDWINEDAIYISTDFGEGSLTLSGYPRIVKRWERGTELSDADLVYEIPEKDMVVAAEVVHEETGTYEFIYRYIDFYHIELFLVVDDELKQLPMPDNFTMDVCGDRLIVNNFSEWQIGGETIPAGQVVSVSLNELLAGNARPEFLFRSTDRISVESIGVTGDKVYVLALNNIKSELYLFEHDEEGWISEKVDLPEAGAITMREASRHHPLYVLTYSSFNQPSTLYLGNSIESEPQEIMRQKDYFDASGIKISQHNVASADGTLIPYFLVHRKDVKYDGTNPTIIYGYGGFQISETPYYSASLGKFWLEKGGVFVLANIRGGGEFGPAWHQAAIRENKQRSYDDFIAVAEDVIERKITSPDHLGIYGGSNGGLLVGAVMVQRPDLYEAVVCFVPLLDMKRYSKLLSGNSWIAEYGDPDKPEDWAFISKYSPYQNVSEGEYPAIIFLTSTRDDRVHPGHARKMAAKMLDQGHEVLLFENTEGGHGASYTPEERARTTAMYYAFFVKELGLE